VSTFDATPPARQGTARDYGSLEAGIKRIGKSMRLPVLQTVANLYPVANQVTTSAADLVADHTYPIG
jgi:hypothetical protein